MVSLPFSLADCPPAWPDIGFAPITHIIANAAVARSDSEEDMWVDEEDPRVQPYVADNEHELSERDDSRRFAEHRKAEARNTHAAAVSGSSSLGSDE